MIASVPVNNLNILFNTDRTEVIKFPQSNFLQEESNNTKKCFKTTVSNYTATRFEVKQVDKDKISTKKNITKMLLQVLGLCLRVSPLSFTLMKSQLHYPFRMQTLPLYQLV